MTGRALSQLNNRADALLTRLNAIPGVVGTFVCDNYGIRLRGYVDESIHPDDWVGFGKKIANMLGALDTYGIKARDLELSFSCYDLHVRNLGNAFATIVCRRDVDWAILRMTTNVAASPIENDKGLQGELMVAAPSTRETLTERQLSANELRMIVKILSNNNKRG